MFDKARARFQRRMRDWARKRQGPDLGRVVLGRRRLYILPTGQGVLYGFTVVVMLMGSLNYSNSMGFMLTFLMAGLGLVSMHATHANLMDLELTAGKAPPVFAGETARFQLQVRNPGRRTRIGITLGAEADQRTITSDITAVGNSVAPVPLQAEKRGWLPLGRLAVETSYPLGLFRAWSWVYLDWRVLVYPAPADSSPPLPKPVGGEGGGRLSEEGEDDFSGLRNYQPGDSPRRIAWKASAREQLLLTKRFSGVGEELRWLDWEALPGVNDEARLSVLCRWVLTAHAANLAYGLKMPGVLFEPASGDAQKERCLTALALHGLPPAGKEAGP